MLLIFLMFMTQLFATDNLPPEENYRGLIRAGVLIAKIGQQASDLGYLLEEGDLNQAKRTVDQLDRELDSFNWEAKSFLGEEYAPTVDQITYHARGNLRSIRANLNEDNLRRAQEEYRLLMDNWDRVDELYQERYEELIQDKEEVRGWLYTLMDWLLEFWYHEQQNEPEAPPSSY